MSKRPRTKPIPAIPTYQAPIFDIRKASKIESYFQENGYVVLGSLDEDLRYRLIEEQVRNIFFKQPWRETLKVMDPLNPTAELDINADAKKYIDVLTGKNLSKETIQHYHDVAPFHSGFGACCDPQSFHMPGVWDIRQNKSLYKVASKLVGTTELWVDINRTIQKMPGKGMEEFIHWDVSYLKMPYIPPKAISGKVAFTDANFICVPGTHTEQSHKYIRHEYSKLYPGARSSDAKFALDPEKPDPLKLIDRRIAVQVPAGSVVFWSPWLLHGVQKNPLSNGIQFGMYLGYMEAVDRSEYFRRARISELEDRIQSYTEGRAPKLWPSLDPVHYYPFRFCNFHKLLMPYIEKTKPGWPGLTTRTIKSGTNKGTVVPDLVPVPDPTYVPPPLSDLGKRLLGITPW